MSVAESLERFRSFIGRSETETDVVTASMVVRFAATLGLPDPPLHAGAPIPPGWHGGLFPPTHRPDTMRIDGQASGGGIVPPIPLPRRRIGGTRTTFLEPLRVGDEVTRTIEIADLQVDEGPQGAMVSILERSTVASGNGLCVVEERETRVLSEERAAAEPTTVPTVPGDPAWQETVEPNTPLLFRFSAIRFNSHRIHYDRDYVTNIEKLPGLVVQSSLISQLLMELCRREAPGRRLTQFESRNVRSVYDVGAFTLAGLSAADGKAATLWANDSEGRLALLATAAFAPEGDAKG
jgi:3-methylfumaryl-CoA hydratase